MAWEWSHTNEAYAAAEQNLQDMDPDTLREIWAEWKARTAGDSEAFDLDAYTLALNDAQPLGRVRLASDIWERASEHRTCDNGGFNAHMCPFGCGSHTVPFDREAPDTYRLLRDEIRSFWDHGDVYGSLMSWWFSLCDVLNDDGEEIPGEWNFKPAASSDSDFYAYGACSRATADDLRRLGARFSRLYDRLERQGRTY